MHDGCVRTTVSCRAAVRSFSQQLHSATTLRWNESTGQLVKYKVVFLAIIVSSEAFKKKTQSKVTGPVSAVCYGLLTYMEWKGSL